MKYFQSNNNSLPPSVLVLKAIETLGLMDSISNEVCSVIDAAELCRNVHSGEWRQSAEEAFEILSSFIHKLNADTNLYMILTMILDNKDIVKGLPEETVILANNLKAEFEAEGIHLTGDDRVNALKLQSEIVSLESEYIRVAAEDQTEPFALGPLPMASYYPIKKWLANYIEQPNTLPPLMVAACSSKHIALPLIRSLEDDKLRQLLWVKTMNEPNGNIRVLGELIKKRQQYAKLLGFQSFAHKFLSNKVAKRPEEVWKLLSSLSSSSRSSAKEDIKILQEYKNKSNNINSNSLKPWDINYYTAVKQASSKNGIDSKSLSLISEYLPLDLVLKGIRDICYDLFEITLNEVPLVESESWLPGTNNGLYKFRAIGPNKEPLGLVYMDLFHRQGKCPGAAHFTVRCGCKLHKVDGNNNTISSNYSNSDPANVYQEPIVALVFNFMSSPHTKMPLLSLHELETLYHEWGHALHSLLSRTRYQHLSGTRGAVDFVEVPSHLFEYFSRHPSIIRRWALHHKSGQPIPHGLIENALLAKKSFLAIELQTQILYSAADQYVFGSAIGDISEMSPEEIYQHLLTHISKMQKELTELPLISNETDANHQPLMSLLSHTHFINYGGGYYSYLYAKMYAAQIWQKLFEADPLSKEGGKKLWKRMLGFGAARDNLEMLEELGGGDLDPSYFSKTENR